MVMVVDGGYNVKASSFVKSPREPTVWHEIFANFDFRVYHRDKIFVDSLQISLWFLTYVTCIEEQEG